FVNPFFGERFNPENVRSYRPDTAINNRTDMNIGGSKFELIPVRGGETHDVMLIYLPDERVMFMGDVIMPYLGAPFDEDGDLQGLFDAIDVIVPQNFLAAQPDAHQPFLRSKCRVLGGEPSGTGSSQPGGLCRTSRGLSGPLGGANCQSHGPSRCI